MTIEKLLNIVVLQKMQISDEDLKKLQKTLGISLIEEAIQNDSHYLKYIRNIDKPDVLKEMNRDEIMKLFFEGVQVIEPYDLQSDKVAIPILENGQIRIDFLANVCSINNDIVQEKPRQVSLIFEADTIVPKTLISKVQSKLYLLSDILQQNISNGPLRHHILIMANTILQNEIEAAPCESLSYSREISDGTETPFDRKSLMKLLETRPGNESFEKAIGPERIARGAENTTIVNNRNDDYNK